MLPKTIQWLQQLKAFPTAIQRAEDALRSYKSASQVSPVSTEATETICGHRHGATVAEIYDFKAGRCARYRDLRKRWLMSRLLVMSEHTNHIQDGWMWEVKLSILYYHIAPLLEYRDRPVRTVSSAQATNKHGAGSQGIR